MQQESDQRTQGRAFVERVANDLKSSELVQTIYFKDTDHLFGYALQWVIDPDNNYLYGYGNTVDNTNALNRHHIVKFRIPKLNESTDGLVTLTKDDLLENYLIEDTYQTHFNPIARASSSRTASFSCLPVSARRSSLRSSTSGI